MFTSAIIQERKVMPDKFDLKDFYKPPTREFIRNSLTYGFVSENNESKDNRIEEMVTYGHSDLHYVSTKSGKLLRWIINFSLKHKEKIKRIPILRQMALDIKIRLLNRARLKEIPLLDFSGIMNLEPDEFIRGLYRLALGREADTLGFINAKEAITSGMPKEVLVFIICSSEEFANRAKVFHMSKYKKAYKRHQFKNKVQTFPIIRNFWNLVATPRRISKLEKVEQERFDILNISNREIISRLNEASHVNVAAINKLESLETSLWEINQNIGKLDVKFDEFISIFEKEKQTVDFINGSLAKVESELTRMYKLIVNQSTDLHLLASAKDKEEQAKNRIFDKLDALELVLQKIQQSNSDLSAGMSSFGADLEKGDQVENLISEKLDALAVSFGQGNKVAPVIYGLPGGVTVIRTKKFIFGVPSEEWRLAAYLNSGGTFEYGTEKYFCSILEKGMNVVDVGANLGIYTLHALAAGCNVYSYEPTPAIYKILVDNVGINGFEPTGRANIFNLAVTDIEGEVEFSVFGMNEHQNNSMFAKSKNDKRIKVKTVSLDNHVGNLPHIDVVKIDVEGAERLVIKGMKNIINNNPGIKIIMEFGPSNLLRGGTNPGKFIQAIRKLDLVIKSIDEGSGELMAISDDDLVNVFSRNILLTKPD